MKTIASLIASLALMVWYCQSVSGNESAVKPNIIIITIDDLGYGDIGPFGSTLNRTPHLDRMAREGKKLTSFYAAPSCSPSRAALLTGCYPLRVGIPEVLFPGEAIGLNPKEPTLAKLLKRQGYATYCIGKWHLGDQLAFLPLQHGFDHFFGLPYANDMKPSADQRIWGRMPPLPLLRDDKVLQAVSDDDQDKLTQWYTEEAVAALRANKDRPVFLYLPHTAVHTPLHPGAKFKGKSNNGDYGDWVEEVDWSVGQILDTVRELQLAERTLVIFSSDNGAAVQGNNGPLRGHKLETHEGGVRVPLIAWWPGKIPAGTTSDGIASRMDVLPTTVKLAGGELPADHVIDGKDIWPLLSGGAEAKSPRETYFYYRGANLRAVRWGPWKLTLTPKGLYNLDRDIGETNDVADQHPEVVARLEELASQMRSDVGDGTPGPGCRPPGRVTNPTTLLPIEGNEWVFEPVRDETSPALVWAAGLFLGLVMAILAAVWYGVRHRLRTGDSARRMKPTSPPG